MRGTRQHVRFVRFCCRSRLLLAAKHDSPELRCSAGGLAMMGPSSNRALLVLCRRRGGAGRQGAGEIAAVLDLSWVRAELAPCCSHIGRPSIDPVLMIRMLLLGCVLAMRSERLLCREVQVNLAYSWMSSGLSIEDKIPDHSAFSRPATGATGTAISPGVCSSAWWRRASRQELLVGGTRASRSKPS